MPDSWRYQPLRNVWIGTTIEDQEHLAPRADALLSTPSRVHFFSCEPLLSAIDLRGYRPAWVIAGGESGARHRPLNPDHVRSLRNQCVERGTAFFFKQHGGRTPDAGGCLLDGREWKEFPKAA
jgi:protein gp37